MDIDGRKSIKEPHYIPVVLSMEVGLTMPLLTYLGLVKHEGRGFRKAIGIRTPLPANVSKHSTTGK